MISELPRKKRGRCSIRYSHLKGNEWAEASLYDPNLPHRLLSAAERAHLPLRDKLIVRIACGYVTCIRDILRLTIGDWRACGCQLEIQVHRQVSRGQGVGMLRLRPDTASLLRGYIHGERKEYDLEHRDLVQLAEKDPLFLTAGGCAYRYQTFVLQWETLCQAAGISLPLHGLRHWFVIRALRQTDERTHDPVEHLRGKAALIKHMGWQTPKTLRVYEKEYHCEKNHKAFDDLLEELSANDPPSLSLRSEAERRGERSFWQNHWYDVEDQ